MRSKLLRVTVACAAFVAGVSVASIYRYVQQQRSVAQTGVSATLPQLASEPPVSEDPCPSYPVTSGIRPLDIVNFIDAHPKSNLDGLWQRLEGTDADSRPVEFSVNDGCPLTQANIFEYNLDDDVEREVVLQIKHQFQERYSYLIFNGAQSLNPKFLGTINVYSKYQPADPLVLVTNDRAWLIVQGTGATGSGLGAWRDWVYEVSNSGVRQVGSYLAEVSQSGYYAFPSKYFSGRLMSCDIENGRATLKVSYTIEYFGYDTSLFTKRKTAVLIRSLKDGSSFVDAARSEISPYEFETIYNFDSMDDDDFLTYNRAELRAIATGNDSEKKAWLKEFLKEFLDDCGDGAFKRELEGLLH